MKSNNTDECTIMISEQEQIAKEVYRYTEQAEIRDIKIKDIIVGERIRQDLGDIPGLAGSIDSLGLLHPIIVMPVKLKGRTMYQLISGQRRLEAFKLLQFGNILARILYSHSEELDN